MLHLFSKAKKYWFPMTSFPVVQRFDRSGEKEKDKTRPNFEFFFFCCWLAHSRVVLACPFQNEMKTKWIRGSSFSGSVDLFSCCVLVLFVFIGSLGSNTVCYVLCSWPIRSSCCRLHAISLNFARENSIFLSQTLIFIAVVCLLVLNVLLFLSSQPLERRCSLTKGVSYFLLILSCPLQRSLASSSTSIFFLHIQSKESL